jgi:deazaflavin-dependent oxidoreductase (nitroreductase family)
MHLPRDPGEWLVMGALMAGVMVVGMLGIHGLRSHMSGHEGPMRPGIAMSFATWVVHRMLSLGIPVSILGPMMLLTVRGRQSGKARTIPVDVHDVAGRRYLIATHGVGAWVLNLRAAGEGTLGLGRTRTTFTSRELVPEEAGPVMHAALGPLVASDGWRGAGVRNNLRVNRGSGDTDYVAAARDHPVFEVQPTP